MIALDALEAATQAADAALDSETLDRTYVLEALVEAAQVLFAALALPAEDEDEERGAGIDTAAQSTGHLPGYYDNDPRPLPSQDKSQADDIAAEREFYQREQAAELAAEREETLREMAAEATYHPTIAHDPRTSDDRPC